MSAARPTVLITGAGGPIGVNVTRSLRMLDDAPRLVGTDCNRYHLCLALTDVIEEIPPAREREAYFAALRDICQRESVDMLLPTHPVEVRALLELGEALDALEVARCLPPLDVVERCQSKWKSYQRFVAAGVPAPRTELLADRAALDAVFSELSRDGAAPVWVRGAGVPGIGVGVASLPCRDAAVAAAWVEHFRGWGGFIASEFLPGQNLTWLGLYFEGQLVACQSRERLEYVIPHVSPSGITGAPAVSRTVRDPRLRAVGDAAVRAVCEEAPPHGAFFVDLKGDAEGQPRVTEVNGGRFGTTIHFYSEAGFNFPALLVALCLGGALPEGAPIEDPIAPDTYWIRTLDCGPVLLRPDEARARGFAD
ncbi:MAG: hypothetical protein KC503_27930 [Myxococcales bacterium]|nr:hypothetical protein [Myxococcales bacterium]